MQMDKLRRRSRKRANIQFAVAEFARIRKATGRTEFLRVQLQIGGQISSVLPFVFQEQMQLVRDLLGFAAGVGGGQFGVEDELVGGAVLGVGAAFESGAAEYLPVDFATVVAADFVADVFKVFSHVERNGIVFEVFDF